MTYDEWVATYVTAMVSALLANPDWTDTHAREVAHRCSEELYPASGQDWSSKSPDDAASETIVSW